MTQMFPPCLALPGDLAVVEAALARPGGLAAAAVAGGAAHLARAIGALDLSTLVGLAEGTADAIALYRQWLAARGTEVAACGVWFNLGVQLANAGDPAGAAVAQRRALELKPDFHRAALCLGLALEAGGDPEAGVAVWRAALPDAEERRQLHVQLGRVLEDRRRLGPAAEELRAALLIDPDQPDVQQHLVHMRQRMTAWPALDLDVPGIDLEALPRHVGPLAALALFDDPALQAAAAADWIARKTVAPGRRLAPAEGYRHDRIRLGYLSSDFCRHAMSFLIAELLECHDRTAFEVTGYDASPEDGSDIRARVLAAFDRHVPIGGMDDATAAAAIRADEIDVLIDLNGLTLGARPGVLRWKPAPVQITWLGYIGPVPLPELDWMLCDAITVPEGAEAGYAPAPLRIEGCFQPNDGRAFALPPVDRAAEGLPDDAYVYCCASHHYKITPEVFAAWTEIVQGAPGSVLWLIDDNPESRAALTDRWRAAGLAAERLIFAPRVDPDRYRARLALADLFLDTSPYNAGVIASDALRMGLPVLTVAGRAFAARMGASLLTAVGLQDCIARDLPDYVARAVALGRDPARQAALRGRLDAGAWAHGLGDAAAFARRFEAVLRRVGQGG